ncbi:endophilin-A3b isoform X2 [Clupea harengus]|uniref:Endophilin-A3b isoform X2 n=1 Tax=Clupea harengus TaxID=7950 RepID=A0A6P8F760_CLUHA|nr:endophilin-A3b isoform X2 [Clupea harengus]
MSVAGLKKQFHKASQLLNEKINGAEGTKLDEEFLKMEKKIDVTHKLVLELVPKTTEYLQPNPACRAKLGMLNTVSRIRGQVKTVDYPQTEGVLGDCMLRYGRELGVESSFGSALADIGEALKQMAQARNVLDVQVKDGFIDPLQTLQEKDLKEIMYHLRKMEGRRLDFDYKKRRKGRISNQELKLALEKFEESKELAERSMFNHLENDMEQVSHLSALVEAVLDYHRQSCSILENLNSDLKNRLINASNQPTRQFTPKPITSSGSHTMCNGFSNTPTLRISDSSSLQFSDVTMNGGVNGKKYSTADPFTTIHPRPESPPNSIYSTVDQFTVLPQRPENPPNSIYSTVDQFTNLSHRPGSSPSLSEGGCPLDQPCCRALYNFQPENEGELGFKEGDLIILTNQIDENWYEGMISGESGFFPISYVNVLVPLPQ